MIERQPLLNALRFLTVLPVPDAPQAPEPDWLTRATAYFPAIGILIGSISALTLLLGHALFGPALAALLAVAASIAVTGALHEDGLADTADSLGGWTLARRLEIMKDSRIGTYGALALGLGVALRITALAQMPLWAGVAALIGCHAAARAAPALVMKAMSYAGDSAAMKVSYAETPQRPEDVRLALLTSALALVPMLVVSSRALALGLTFGAALAALLAAWMQRRLGGYTGDVLGATEQMFEIGFLLGVAAVLRV